MAGGDEKFYREGQYVSGAAQRLLIDKKNGPKNYNITNIGQLTTIQKSQFIWCGRWW